jgi:hypothetical protein
MDDFGHAPKTAKRPPGGSPGGEPYMRAARALIMKENQAPVRKVYCQLCQILIPS